MCRKRGGGASGGTLTVAKLFAEHGGESVTQDAAGNIYIAVGEIYVYNSSGRQIDTIRVPDRPIDRIFGGTDGKTLFILARGSVYSVQTRFGGLTSLEGCAGCRFPSGNVGFGRRARASQTARKSGKL